MIPDGYTNLAPGKIAAVVTYLEMLERPDLPLSSTVMLRPVKNPDPDWYREVFRRAGEPWLWFSRLEMTDEQLSALLNAPTAELFIAEKDGAEIGMVNSTARSQERSKSRSSRSMPRPREKAWGGRSCARCSTAHGAALPRGFVCIPAPSTVRRRCRFTSSADSARTSGRLKWPTTRAFAVSSRKAPPRRPRLSVKLEPAVGRAS